MKILHIGLSAKTNDGLCRALANGNEYKEISTGDKNFNQAILDLTRTWIPELVFMQIQAEGIIYPATVIHLMKIGAKVYNWTGDVRVPLPKWYIEIGRLITATLFTNMNDVDTLRELGLRAHHLHIGYDEKIYFPDYTKQQNSYKVVFLANNYPNNFHLSTYREEISKKLKERYKNFFGLFGSGWRENAGNFMGNQKGEADLYQSVPMAINISHYELSRYSSDRILRIMGSGCLCLCKWFPEIEKDYIDGHHLKVWRTDEELFSLIDFFMKDENINELDRIRKLGQEYTQRTFTWNNMVDNLLKIHTL